MASTDNEVNGEGLAFAAVSVPTALGLTPNPLDRARSRGTWQAPAALRSAGLLESLRARNAGIVEVPRYCFERHSVTGIHNREGVAAQTREVATLVGAVLDRKERPLVLGGDCSVLIGAALALRRRGRYGLVFIDGHLDFRHLGNTERLSAAAGEDLAIVTGRGLDEHANVDGLEPYFRDGDVVAIGEREHDADTSDIRSTEITVLDLDHVRQNGPIASASTARGRLADARDGYWVHLDVDVLDSDVLSAVDSPQPDGLRVDELVSLLQELCRDSRMRGLDVTIYDPELDPDRTQAALLNRLLVSGLTE